MPEGGSPGREPAAAGAIRRGTLRAARLRRLDRAAFTLSASVAPSYAGVNTVATTILVPASDDLAVGAAGYGRATIGWLLPE